MVIGGAFGKGFGTLNHGRCLTTGSSSRSFPASRSCRIAVAVKTLLTEHQRYQDQAHNRADDVLQVLPSWRNPSAFRSHLARVLFFLIFSSR